MVTSPMPLTTPNQQFPSIEPNPITQSPSSSIAGSGKECSGNGLELLSAVCADNAYSPATQIYDNGLSSPAPLTMSPTQAIVPASTQTSPGTNNRQTAIALWQDKGSQKRPSSSFNPANIKKAQILEGNSQFQNFNDVISL